MSGRIKEWLEVGSKGSDVLVTLTAQKKPTRLLGWAQYCEGVSGDLLKATSRLTITLNGSDN